MSRKISNVWIFLFACLNMIPTNSWANESSPEWLIRQVINTYRSLETYRVVGHTDTELTQFNQGGKVSQRAHRFSILLKKPNGYLITWEDDFPPFKTAMKGAVWNVGTQAYVYSQTTKGYMKIPTDIVNLQTQAGVSTGSTSTIPELFFTFFPEKDLRLSRLNDAVVKGQEEIQGEPCYVLEGREKNMVFTYWISVDNFFIQQYTFRAHNPNGQERDVALTEGEAKSVLRAKGVEPTKKRIEKIIRMAENGKEKLFRINESS